MAIRQIAAFEPFIRDILARVSGAAGYTDAAGLKPCREWFLSGGRNSGKTATALLTILLAAMQMDAARKSSVIALGRTFQTTIRDSLLGDVRKLFRFYPELETGFRMGESYLKSAGGFVNFVFPGTNINSMNLKGLADVSICLIDEADGINERGLEYLVPTIRENNSVLCWIYNPSTVNTPFAKYTAAKGFPIERQEGKLYITRQGGYRMIHSNYPSNGLLSNRSRLEIEQAKKDMSPVVFNNIYGGEYVLVSPGGLLERELTAMREEGRVCNLQIDPTMPLYATVDLGMTDLTVFWLFQYLQDSGRVNIVDCIMGNQQTIQQWLELLSLKGYGRAKHFLPQDSTGRRGYTTAMSAADVYNQMGQPYDIIPNRHNFQRLNDLRNIFPKLWFDGTKCANGLHIISFLRMKTVNGVATDSIEHNTESLPTRDCADPLLMLPQIAELLSPPPRDTIYEMGNHRAPAAKYDW